MILSANSLAQLKVDYAGLVVDMESGNKVSYASIMINNSQVICNQDGYFYLKLLPGNHTITIQSLGYEEYKQSIILLSSQQSDTFRLKQSSLSLPDIKVVAQQKNPESSAFYISQNAIEHLQPNNFADILQLLPGSSYETQSAIENPTRAQIRGNSSLGTSISIDGLNVETTSSMQHFRLNANTGDVYKNTPPSHTGTGPDLRQLSVDNIASVKVIGGVPSVKYGNCSSGVVMIQSKRGISPWQARLKSNGYTRLAALSKGFGWLNENGLVNLSLDYLQSYNDLRSPFDGYERLTASIAYSDQFQVSSQPLTFNLRFRFYQNTDEKKKDPDTLNPEEAISLKQQGASVSIDGQWLIGKKYISRLEYILTHTNDQETSYAKRYFTSEASTICLSKEPGMSEGLFLPSEFLAENWIKGQPIYYKGQINANQNIDLPNKGKHEFMLGAEYKYSINKGEGKSYAPYPIDNSFARSMPFFEIPALRTLSLYAEEELTLPIKGINMYIQGGIRFNNIQFSGYTENTLGWYYEPRINGSIELIKRNHTALKYLNLRVGIGKFVQTPPLAYLHPTPAYEDFISYLNYSNNPDNRSVIYTTFLWDKPSAVKPAIKLKQEIGLDITWKRIKSNLTFYNESGKHNFSLSTDYKWFDYIKYNTSSTNINQLNNLSSVPYTTEYQIAARQAILNLGNAKRKGLEYTIDLGQFKALYTNLIIDGAWRSSSSNMYRNEFVPSEILADGIKAIGTYHNQIYCQSLKTQHNTRIRLITHIPQLRLIFSGSCRFFWFEKYKNHFYPMQPISLEYHDKEIPFSNKLIDDPDYRKFIIEEKVVYENVPFRYVSDIRLSKEMGTKFKLSLFVNNFLNHRPVITTFTNKYKRLTNTTDFGAELLIKIR